MFSEEFEGTFSPLKESLGRNGCLCWSRHARHRVSNAACVKELSPHGLGSDLWLLYGNTKYHNNIPPSSVSRQDMNDFFFLPLSLLIWAHGIMLFSLLSFGGLWIVVWTFVCWILSFACGQALFHKPQLRIDRIYPGTLHTPPHIPWISLHHSHQSLAPLFYFLSLNFLPLSYVFLLFFPLSTLFQLEHSWNTSALVSALITVHIFTHTLSPSCDAALQHHSPH